MPFFLVQCLLIDIYVVTLMELKIDGDHLIFSVATPVSKFVSGLWIVVSKCEWYLALSGRTVLMGPLVWFYSDFWSMTILFHPLFEWKEKSIMKVEDSNANDTWRNWFESRKMTGNISIWWQCAMWFFMWKTSGPPVHWFDITFMVIFLYRIMLSDKFMGK